MNTLRKTVLVTAIAGMSIASTVSVAASSATSSLKLQTSLVEVNGVREIEAGKYAKGITKTLAALTKTSVNRQRAPLLNNLCVAQILTADFINADKACNQAVDAAPNSATALNNRAIFHCVTEQPEACQNDLQRAFDLRKGNRVVSHNAAMVAPSVLLVKN